MSNLENSAFNTLLATWRRHQELRSGGANVSDLNDSRVQLDRARHTMHTVR